MQDALIPTTAFQRPIQDAYFYCFTVGVSSTICFASLIYVAKVKGLQREMATILHYIHHTLCLLNILMSFYNLNHPYGCNPVPVTAVAFSIAEIACDTYIFLILWIIIPPSKYEQVFRYAWLAYYIIAEYVKRILQYAYIRYLPISVLCRTVVEPTISGISTGIRVSFIVSMGIFLAIAAMNAKSGTIAAVGLKTVIASIFLIVAKISLLVPFSNRISFRSCTVGSLQCVIYQLANRIQAGSMVLLMTWKPKNSEKVYGAKSNITTTFETGPTVTRV
jgi:hypothetical protein